MRSARRPSPPRKQGEVAADIDVTSRRRPPCFAACGLRTCGWRRARGPAAGSRPRGTSRPERAFRFGWCIARRSTNILVIRLPPAPSPSGDLHIHTSITRPRLLQAGGIGQPSPCRNARRPVAGQRRSGPRGLQPRRVMPKSCIFVLLCGGPSHIDTWDLKPEAPDSISRPLQAGRHQRPRHAHHQRAAHPVAGPCPRLRPDLRSMTHVGNISNHLRRRAITSSAANRWPRPTLRISAPSCRRSGPAEQETSPTTSG